MITGMRRSFIAVGLGLLVLFQAQAGCDQNRTLMCGASVDDFCAAAGDCVLTWDEAVVATSFCSEATRWPPQRAACGRYHVVAISLVDASRSYYYDGASGLLTAIVTADAVRSMTACNAGPADGFSPPVCSGVLSEELLQCRDGGGAPNGDAALDAGSG